MGDARIDARALDEIEERANGATKGPWSLDRAGYIVAPGDTDSQVKAVATLHTRSDDIATDADFITHARSEIPSLVAEVRASWSECEKLKAALAALVEIVAPGHNGKWAGTCPKCDVVKTARALVGSAPQNEADE